MKPSAAYEESILMFRTVARHFVYFFMRLVTEKNLSVIFSLSTFNILEKQEKDPAKCTVRKDVDQLAKLYIRALSVVCLDRLHPHQYDP